MFQVNKLRYVAFCVVCFVCTLCAYAQGLTSVSGSVIDAETGEYLPFVQVFFVDSNQDNAKPTTFGTTTDGEGRYHISNLEGYTVLHFQMIGYKTEKLILRKGQARENVKIHLQPDTYALQDVIVTPKKKKERYRRKGNPAVELIRNVIAHKDSATIKTENYYTADVYARMSFALDNFNPNFKKGFWKKVDFIQFLLCMEHQE